jgi:surface antigen/LysM repeat protein
LVLSDEQLSANQMQRQVLTASAPSNTKELLDEGADVAVYEVKEGDSVSSIANDFDITVNTILWANDIEDADMIKPGDKIFILPVAGVKHVVKEGDSIEDIAEEYEAEKEEIIAFNELPADGSIEDGDELIIPGGEKETPAALQKRDYYSSGVAGSGRNPSIIDRNPAGGHRFPYGQCTWYVAQHKYVPWGGNAGTWLYNARAYGVETGKTPKVGSIIVTSESWYGHVGIVEAVSGNSVTISEMNYKGVGITNKRTLNAGNRVIKGYIY